MLARTASVIEPSSSTTSCPDNRSVATTSNGMQVSLNSLRLVSRLSNSFIFLPEIKPRRGSWTSKNSLESILFIIRPSIFISAPQAYIPPTIAPMLLPTIKSKGILFSCNTCNIPIWASPRALPAPSTRAILGRSLITVTSGNRYCSSKLPP